jgi:hypothetical protein
MNQEELAHKVESAKAVGVPVFMTKTEVKWLRDILLDFCLQIGKGKNLSLQDKNDLINAVSIGVKCADGVMDETD